MNGPDRSIVEGRGIVIHPRKPAIITALLLAAFLLPPYLLGLAPYFYGRPRVGGLSLAGLGREEAGKILRDRVRSLAAGPLLLVHGDERWTASPARLGIRIDYRRPLREAWSLGRRGGPLRRWREILFAPAMDLPLTAEPRPAKVRAALHELEPEVEREPVNAAFDIETGALLPERPGRRLDLARTMPVLARVAVAEENRLAELAMLPVAAETTRRDLLATRVKYVAGKYSTIFDPGVHVRAANINRGAAKINGLLIPPGGVFSFNAATGPRDKANGYGEALEIVNRRLVPGVGGGICQVSSTLYNAVLLAGLPVLERHPHSLPLGYVPLGRDATVYYDRLDLVFRNNTAGNLLILAQTKGDRITVALLAGEKPAHRVELGAEILEEIPYERELRPDPGLAPGERQLESPGQKGYKVRIERLFLRDGRRVKEEVLSVDTYQPQPEVVRVNPAAMAAPGPAPRE